MEKPGKYLNAILFFTAAIFIGLKLGGVIDWTWLAVLAPFWVMGVLRLIVVILFLMGIGIFIVAILFMCFTGLMTQERMERYTSAVRELKNHIKE